MTQTTSLTPLLPNDFLGRTFASFLRWPMFELVGMTQAYPMRLEEFRDDGELVVRAELPGLDPDKDIRVTVEQGLLTVHAERRAETGQEEKPGFYSELHYGAFERTIPLPVGTGEGAVTASYDKGILEIRVPVSKGVASKNPVHVSVSH